MSNNCSQRAYERGQNAEGRERRERREEREARRKVKGEEGERGEERKESVLVLNVEFSSCSQYHPCLGC